MKKGTRARAAEAPACPTMDRIDTHDTLQTVLLELDELHDRESAILKKMDSEALDDLTAKKQVLCQQLRELMASSPPAPKHRALLERLRQRATLNQLLTVHARDAVRSVLAEAAGCSVAMDSQLPGIRKPVVQDGLRVNVRG